MLLVCCYEQVLLFHFPFSTVVGLAGGKDEDLLSQQRHLLWLPSVTPGDAAHRLLSMRSAWE